MQHSHPVVIAARSIHRLRTTVREEPVGRRRAARAAKPVRCTSNGLAQADRSLAFATAVHQQVNNVLVRCEEQYPVEGPHSVMYVVVQRDAALWSQRLAELHQEYFGSERPDSAAPVKLEVVDHATHQSVQRLAAAGVLALTTRAARALWPADETTTSPLPLSEAEREKAAGYRGQAARKLKMARVLAAGDLHEEARAALLEAIEPLGRALAVENRVPEPQSLEDALLPPLGAAWKETLPFVRSFLREPSRPLPPILAALERI